MAGFSTGVNAGVNLGNAIRDNERKDKLMMWEREQQLLDNAFREAAFSFKKDVFNKTFGLQEKQFNEGVRQFDIGANQRQQQINLGVRAQDLAENKFDYEVNERENAQKADALANLHFGLEAGRVDVATYLNTPIGREILKSYGFELTTQDGAKEPLYAYKKEGDGHVVFLNKQGIAAFETGKKNDGIKGATYDRTKKINDAKSASELVMLPEDALKDILLANGADFLLRNGNPNVRNGVYESNYYQDMIKQFSGAQQPGQSLAQPPQQGATPQATPTGAPQQPAGGVTMDTLLTTDINSDPILAASDPQVIQFAEQTNARIQQLQTEIDGYRQWANNDPNATPAERERLEDMARKANSEMQNLKRNLDSQLGERMGLMESYATLKERALSGNPGAVAAFENFVKANSQALGVAMPQRAGQNAQQAMLTPEQEQAIMEVEAQKRTNAYTQGLASMRDRSVHAALTGKSVGQVADVENFGGEADSLTGRINAGIQAQNMGVNFGGGGQQKGMTPQQQFKYFTDNLNYFTEDLLGKKVPKQVSQKLINDINGIAPGLMDNQQKFQVVLQGLANIANHDEDNLRQPWAVPAALAGLNPEDDRDEDLMDAYINNAAGTTSQNQLYQDFSTLKMVDAALGEKDGRNFALALGRARQGDQQAIRLVQEYMAQVQQMTGQGQR